MKELSIERMEDINGGKYTNACGYAIAHGTASIWMVGIGMMGPVGLGIAAAWTIGTLAASALGYGPDPGAC